MTGKSKRIRALLLLLVTITSLVMLFAETIVCAGDVPAVQECSSASSGHDVALIHDGNSPCVPSQEQSSGDHFCCGACNGPCHAPVSSTPVVIAYTPVSTPLSFAEISPFIPEVYLSKFIPPQNLA
jgi:hypothetical protein